jgi:hypothetical protein
MKNNLLLSVYITLLFFSQFLLLGQTVNVTFQVDMTQQTNFTTPEVNGAFNNWCGNCNSMSDSNLDGIWEVTLPLSAGSYDYKFSADNWASQETLSPTDVCAVTNGGFTNRNIVVGNTDIVLPPVCWGTCSPCSGNPSTVNVTFRVDMTQQTSFTTPEVNGVFNNWCGNCNSMTDTNSDGIWEVTIPLNSGAYEYKFSADNWGSQETLNQGDPCTVTNSGFTNRSLNLGSNDTILPVVCWGTCGSCINTSPLNITVEVCNPNAQTVRITGPFWGWGLNTGPLATNNGNGTWTFTFNPPPTQNMEYLIVVDSVMENLINDVQNGGVCAPITDYVNYANRVWIPGSGNVNITYDRCVPCSFTDFVVTAEICGTPATNVRLTGPLWGWSNQFGPAGVSNGDGTWTITLSPAPNDTIVYLLVKDGQIEDLIPSMASGGTCAPLTDFSTFANREWIMGQGGVYNSFGQCTTCLTSVKELTKNKIEVYPNPTNDEFNISNKTGYYTIRILNLLGQVMLKKSSNQINTKISLKNMESGVYILYVDDENGSSALRIIKE